MASFTLGLPRAIPGKPDLTLIRFLSPLFYVLTLFAEVSPLLSAMVESSSCKTSSYIYAIDFLLMELKSSF